MSNISVYQGEVDDLQLQVDRLEEDFSHLSSQQLDLEAVTSSLEQDVADSGKSKPDRHQARQLSEANEKLTSIKLQRDQTQENLTEREQQLTAKKDQLASTRD